MTKGEEACIPLRGVGGQRSAALSRGCQLADFLEGGLRPLHRSGGIDAEHECAYDADGDHCANSGRWGNRQRTRFAVNHVHVYNDAQVVVRRDRTGEHEDDRHPGQDRHLRPLAAGIVCRRTPPQGECR